MEEEVNISNKAVVSSVNIVIKEEVLEESQPVLSDINTIIKKEVIPEESQSSDINTFMKKEIIVDESHCILSDVNTVVKEEILLEESPSEQFLDETDLGLNEQHESIIRSYMQFSRYQRAQSLKTVQMAIQDVTDSRLLDPTYTLSEVQELLQNLQDLVHAEIETELISIAHSNVLLLTQMFSQAEKWHLRLTVDLSEIQNGELLEQVKALEVTELTSRNKLQPIADEDSGIALLRIEIERLQQENTKLENTVKDLETQIVQLKEERNKLLEGSEKHEDEIVMLKRNLDDFKLKLENIAKDSNNSPEKTDPEHLLGEYEAVLSEQLSAELESMRQQVLHVQSQLTLAEQELESKFNQTAAYCNMKKMLAKKNEQVKDLRIRLQKYESPDDGVSD